MLGALLEETACLPEATAMGVFQDTVKKKELLDLDRRALDAGAHFVKTHHLVNAMSQPDGYAGD
jgi:hypothetical protein